MHYYQHSIGDYRRDTAHLTLLEHGIYRQLLDTYYLDEAPLCSDVAKLMRSHSVRTADEQQALQNVLSDFFILTESGFFHKRCEEGISDFHKKSEKARASAMARWEKNANALPSDSESTANGMLTINHKPITNKRKCERFADFWSAWPSSPRKVGKAACEKKWLTHSLDDSADQIISTIENLKTSQQWLSGYEPAPLTFLNQRRWEDMDVGASRRAL